MQIIDFLEANLNRKVKDILDELRPMLEKPSKQRQPKNFKLDDEGNPIAIFCYYHKQRLDPRIIPFGKKANSPTGLNVMCKDGAAKWTKQQRDAKVAKEALLQRAAQGEQLDIAAALKEIEEARLAIIPLPQDLEEGIIEE